MALLVNQASISQPVAKNHLILQLGLERSIQNFKILNTLKFILQIAESDLQIEKEREETKSNITTNFRPLNGIHLEQEKKYMTLQILQCTFMFSCWSSKEGRGTNMRRKSFPSFGMKIKESKEIKQ